MRINLLICKRIAFSSVRGCGAGVRATGVGRDERKRESPGRYWYWVYRYRIYR